MRKVAARPRAGARGADRGLQLPLLVLALVRAGAGTLAGLGTSTEFALDEHRGRWAKRACPRVGSRPRSPRWIGRSLLALDLVAAEARVEQDPWVARRLGPRMLPGHARVTVRERVPTALALVDGQVQVVDATGHRIGPLGDDLAESCRCSPGSTSRDESRLDLLLRRGVEALRGIERASPTLARRGVRARPVVARPGGAAHDRRRDPWILLDPERIDRNLSAYLELRGEIERLAGPASQIDLRWQDRITAHARNARPPREKMD